MFLQHTHTYTMHSLKFVEMNIIKHRINGSIVWAADIQTACYSLGNLTVRNWILNIIYSFYVNDRVSLCSSGKTGACYAHRPGWP